MATESDRSFLSCCLRRNAKMNTYACRAAIPFGSDSEQANKQLANDRNQAKEKKKYNFSSLIEKLVDLSHRSLISFPVVRRAFFFYFISLSLSNHLWYSLFCLLCCRYWAAAALIPTSVFLCTWLVLFVYCVFVQSKNKSILKLSNTKVL